MLKIFCALLGILFLDNSAVAGTEPPSILKGRPPLLGKRYHCQPGREVKEKSSARISLQFMGKQNEIAFVQGLSAKQLDYFAAVQSEASVAQAEKIYEKFGYAVEASAAMVLSKEPPARLKIRYLKKNLSLETEIAGKTQHLECKQN